MATTVGQHLDAVLVRPMDLMIDKEPLTVVATVDSPEGAMEVIIMIEDGCIENQAKKLLHCLKRY